ncbi:MAG: ATP-binding cassette domain-containing protein [Sphaerochaeta sp.]|jgi:energy-coupling factor transport system ATP-binding protein|nr:ATP-binding cassette domain-containing protein [Sphaerochaeta sp.]MDX9914558.1 ATP-binding cassette domain-containing protein [Sphaerochaeta sp.]
MAHALTINNLRFSYLSYQERSNEPLFCDLSLSIEEGERVLLLAPFDMGKTTLAKIIGGVCPKYFPGTMTGSITLFGTDLSTVEPWQLLTEVGYVSQNPAEQFIATTVEEEIAFPLESLGLSRAEMRERIATVLEAWGLAHLGDANESELSGGERKRVLLAIQQALSPRLWLLDEPFDDLDPVWRVRLKETILAGGKTTLVLASRYLADFADLFDRVLLLDERRIVALPLRESLSRFSTLCGDDKPSPLLDQTIEDQRRTTLSAGALAVERKRRSTTSTPPFEMTVDSFALESGELVTLTGANGSGKSSFSRLLCGLDEPKRGVIAIDGKRQSTKELNRSVGYLFQNPDLQIFLPTVEEELSWSLRRRRELSSSEIAERVGFAADLFALDLGDTPTTMSYPKRKALQAAVYYLLDRPFYILDELDSALTYHSALSIMASLRQRGSGILLITHDRLFAAKVEGRAYTIEAGRLIER